jgi:hypothetical protein
MSEETVISRVADVSRQVIHSGPHRCGFEAEPCVPSPGDVDLVEIATQHPTNRTRIVDASDARRLGVPVNRKRVLRSER